ncbi:predicted protein [Scheffersomyces stipitis CBS 6054]|uniref:Uncharacterized protein n=1 Tax=Scheffersomyces stipitis (strain ATCC 58785 / CBS 6054 / NBRC 10063 / NRRL Y-11545) TaxID=322104 RepID=A3M073_PICST|nr:predicted protein [Scheffersomyces stipitis CBS 6054]ABN68666.2 predicted protein [Scheffersomyces stipitis CBS 6054]
MIDSEKLQNHFRGHDELSEILHQDELRKSLIRLAVLRVVTLNRNKPKRAKTNEPDELVQMKKQLNEYELYTNKLKQESSTKLKLQEAKLESAQDEVAKLKLQLAAAKEAAKDTSKPMFSVPSSSSFRPRINLNGLSRPKSATLSSIKKFPLARPTSVSSERNYLSPTFNSINKSIYSSDVSTVLTPISNRTISKPRGKYITARNLHELGNSPVTSKFGISKPPTKLTTLTQKIEAQKDENEPPKTAEAETEAEIGAKSATTSVLRSSPAKTPSRKSFIENFDKSSGSSSPSPEFTPMRVSSDKTSAPVSRDIEETGFGNGKVTRIEKFDNTLQTDEDTFASANSTLVGNVSGDVLPEKKKTKKLQLWKSGATKVPLTAPGKKPHSLGLEDENLNSLNYYEDGNFATDESPPKPQHKRQLELSPVPEPAKRRKHNTFRID